MFNFLIRKDARKILKRKDSDAGEKGIFFLILIFKVSSFSHCYPLGYLGDCLWLQFLILEHFFVIWVLMLSEGCFVQWSFWIVTPSSLILFFLLLHCFLLLFIDWAYNLSPLCLDNLAWGVGILLYLCAFLCKKKDLFNFNSFSSEDIYIWNEFVTCEEMIKTF